MSVTPASQRPIRYSSHIDVGNILNTSFSSGSNPTELQVTDMIDRADSWVDNATNHSWLTRQTVDEYHDAISSGPRAGTIFLHNRPVLSIVKAEFWENNAWTTGQQGYPSETDKQTYYAYLPEGKIVWHRLRLNQRLRYRVTYNWGYATVPDFIRDLSARKTALLVLDFWAGKHMPAEEVSDYRGRLQGEIDRLIVQGGYRPAVAVG